MYVVPEAVRLEVTLTFTPGVVYTYTPALLHFTPRHSAPGVSAELATLSVFRSFVFKINLILNLIQMSQMNFVT